eukprot:TRINITY_DN31319_c0_g1_i1.p1 TRINITY_DN31319_c0_g1~~TRINITY_DN31319_c0_g1_i1.p1  ORF type:complete len:820 (-),score=141.65 TRINITY_DN31319_c0_g1_i1:315-2774(-)
MGASLVPACKGEWQGHPPSHRLPMMNGQVEAHLNFSDVQSLCREALDIMRARAGVPTVVVVKINQTSLHDEEETGSLNDICRLVRLSPHPFVCEIEAEFLSPFMVLLALAFDFMLCQSPATFQAGTQDKLLGKAQQQWHTFTGQQLKDASPMDFSMVSLSSGASALSDFAPYYWTSFRNLSKAMLWERTDKKEHFTAFFGPKIMTIFAAAETVTDTAERSLEEKVHAGAGAGGSLRRNMSDTPSTVASEQSATSINIQASADALEITLGSDVLYSGLDEIRQLLNEIKEKRIKTLRFVIVPGMCDGDDIFPEERTDHPGIYKWHRVWEQMLAIVSTKKASCVVQATRISNPLLELFFSSQDRVWTSCSEEIHWARGLYAYCPGPSALSGLSGQLSICALRRFLVQGMNIEEARQVGLLTAKANAGQPPREVSMGKAIPRGPAPQIAPERGCGLLGYGLAVPEGHQAMQEEIADMLDIKDYRSVFTDPHIETRYLADLVSESPGHSKQLDLMACTEKHLKWAAELLKEAIKKACEDAGIAPAQIGCIVVASSTGYLLPGLTAYVIKDKDLGIPPTAGRADIVGMGCHAGLNSLKTAATWAAANRGTYAIACSVEISSAQYIWGQASRRDLTNVIVNSLFGDGCFCAVLHAAPPDKEQFPAYFEMPSSWWMQLCHVGALDDMIYTVEREEQKFRFMLSELAPYHVGQALVTMLHHALQKGIPIHHVQHFVTHTGGKTVLEMVAVAMGLDQVAELSLPYAVEALRSYGNQSSASIMFAFHKLVQSNNVHADDYGLLVSMGPGAGLEMAMFTAGTKFPRRLEN